MHCQPTSFENQVVIITGGADGLGYALASRLAGKGAHIALFDVDKDKLEKSASTLGEKARGHVVDVTSSAAVDSAIRAVLADLGRIDVLVNSAGLTGRTGIKTHEVEEQDFERVFAVNVRGAFLTSKFALPHMVKQAYGRILHVASIAGKEGNAGMLAYSASKAAVIGLTKAMGKEYAETGVLVNAVAPAVIRTAMVAAMPREQVEYMTSRIPMKRCGELEEFASLAEFAVSPANGFTTGFTFDLSGGRAVY